MDTTFVKECSICNHEFDEEQRCPRNLSCGHCLCTYCINQMIVRNEKLCPFCRRSFQARSVQEMAKNILALDLLKHVRDMEENAARVTCISRSEMVNYVKQQSCQMNMQNILDCKKSVAQIKNIKKKNFELRCNISQELVEIRKWEEHNESKMKFLEKENEKLDKLMTEVEKKQHELAKVKAVLYEASTFAMVDSAVDAAEASNTLAQNWLLKLKTDVSSKGKLYQGIQKNMKTGEKRRFFMNILTVNNNNEITTQMEDLNLDEIIILPQITEMNAITRYLINIDGLHAKQEMGGKARYGKLSIFENKLCLHHLRELKTPPNGWTFTFDDVMRYVDPSSRLTFLEFGNKEVTLGKIYIRLTPDTKRAQNFAIMCTGEMGPSYSGTYIIGVMKDDDVHLIECEDYEHNTGRGGKALVPGSGEEKGGVLARAREVGSVGGWDVGDAKASYFYILTKVNNPGTYISLFGTVESGINVLTEATSLYPNMAGDFKITDSGIVLTK